MDDENDDHVCPLENQVMFYLAMVVSQSGQYFEMGLDQWLVIAMALIEWVQKPLTNHIDPIFQVANKTTIDGSEILRTTCFLLKLDEKQLMRSGFFWAMAEVYFITPKWYKWPLQVLDS